MGSLNDLEEKKVMSTELKKLNSITSILQFILVLLFLIIGMHSYMIYNLSQNCSSKDIADLKKAITGVEKAVHFRYFNLTNSLQDIHNVKLETLHGRVQK